MRWNWGWNVHCALPNLKCKDYGSHSEWIIAQLKLDGLPKGITATSYEWHTHVIMQRSQSKNMRRSQGAAAEAEEHSDFTQMKTVSWKTGAGVNFFLVILWELELEQGQQQQAQKLSWMKVISNDKSVYFKQAKPRKK